MYTIKLFGHEINASKGPFIAVVVLYLLVLLASAVGLMMGSAALTGTTIPAWLWIVASWAVTISGKEYALFKNEAVRGYIGRAGMIAGLLYLVILIFI